MVQTFSIFCIDAAVQIRSMCRLWAMVLKALFFDRLPARRPKRPNGVLKMFQLTNETPLVIRGATIVLRFLSLSGVMLKVENATEVTAIQACEVSDDQSECSLFTEGKVCINGQILELSEIDLLAQEITFNSRNAPVAV